VKKEDEPEDLELMQDLLTEFGRPILSLKFLEALSL
jgi:hypothetical protein